MYMPDVDNAETASEVGEVRISCRVGNVEGQEVPESQCFHGNAEATYASESFDIASSQ